MKRSVLLAVLLALVAGALWVTGTRWIAGAIGDREAGARTSLAPAADEAERADQREPRGALRTSSAPKAAPGSGGERAAVASAPAGAEAGPRLRVRVVREGSRAPVEHARVTVRPAAEDAGGGPELAGAFASELTDERGEASLAVAGLERVVVDVSVISRTVPYVELCGGARRTLELGALAGEPDVTIEVPCGMDARLWIRVVDEASGLAVAGARLFDADGFDPTRPEDVEPDLAEGVSDGSGLLELPMATWAGPRLAWIEARGYGPALVLVAPSNPDPRDPLRVPLRGSAALEVELRGLSLLDAAPEELALRVTARSRDLLALASQLATAGELAWTRAVEPGVAVRFDALPSGAPLRLELAGGEGSVRVFDESIVLDAGESRRVAWAVGGAGVRLVGTVVDQHGEPVPHLPLWLARGGGERDGRSTLVFRSESDTIVCAETTSDGEGRFELADAPRGGSWLGPALPVRKLGDRASHDALPIASAIEVPEGVSRWEVRLEVERGLFVRGVVLAPDGEPAPHAYVWALDGGPAASVPAATGEDGTFALGPLRSGSYTLTAFGRGIHADSEPVVAAAGEGGAVLRLRAGGRITGRAVDAATGEGVPARLVTTRPGAEGGTTVERTGERGRLEVTGLVPGRYDLFAVAADGRCGLARGVVVEDGVETSAVVIPMEPGASVRVRYDGPEPTVLVRAFAGDAMIAFESARAGSEVLLAVCAGLVRIELDRADGGGRERTLELAPGETAEVVFELE